MKENWKDIPNYEGLYQVSNKGRVKSFVSTLGRGVTKVFREHILKPSFTRGYLRVVLTDKNKCKHSLFVHRLVLISFIGEEKGRNQVNHINGIKTDNRLENLEWVTQSENMLHAYRLGLEKPCDNGLKKAVTMYKDGKMVKEFSSIRGMCRELNLDRGSVVRTIKGEYRDYKGYTFKTNETY